ncbi:MAG: hypothetical protein GY749_43095 [Desulfobacteraceae bacterium]|nr:hypothetical protein [Desulfobacteraceae bacterium]
MSEIHKSLMVTLAVFMLNILYFGNTYAQSGPSVKVIVNAPDVKVYVSNELKGVAQPDQPLICRDITTGMVNVKIKAGNHTDLRLIRVDSDKEYQIVFEIPRTKVEELLEQADDYFKKEQYTAPENENALKVYQDVLWIEPENRHAREKLLEIMGIIKKQGDSAYRTRRFNRAKTFYSQYLSVDQFVLDKFEDQNIKAEFQKVKKRFNDLDKGIIPPIPKPAPGYLYVSVNIPNVEVYINGEYKGVANPGKPLKYKSHIRGVSHLLHKVLSGQMSHDSEKF